jgi:chemotaxis protein CheD
MEMLLNSLIDRGASRENLQFKLFGGAQMLGRSSMIGEKNVVFVLNYAEQEHLKIVAQDLGGLEPRKVMFDPLTGKAWLKRIPFTEVHHLQHQEEKYASQLDKESHRKHDDDVELF